MTLWMCVANIYKLITSVEQKQQTILTNKIRKLTANVSCCLFWSKAQAFW